MKTNDTLRDVVERVIVLAYKENVDPLMAALAEEGLDASLQRIVYSERELEFARNSRTFLNHRLAWEKAAEASGYTLICESDFVPCRGMADFPVFWPSDDANAWGYLYQGSPRLLALFGGKSEYLRAHVNPLVAYVVNAHVAKVMLQYFDWASGAYDLKQYFSFDSHLQWFTMSKGAASFMPLRHYGEHGGLPNKEHGAVAKLSRDGEHHADNLMGPLRFLPQYAAGSRNKYRLVRLKSHLLGFGRLLSGRWIEPTNVYEFTTRERLRAYVLGLARLLPRWGGGRIP